MQPEGVSALRSESMGREGNSNASAIWSWKKFSSMIVKRTVIDDFEETFSIWESSSQWSCGICSENKDIVRKIDLAACWRCNLLPIDEEEKDLWILELALFPQIQFVHPHVMARALEAYGGEDDDSEMKKISALTSCYSGVIIDLRSVRDASDMRPEPEKLQFRTLDDTKAYIARKTPAIDALFGSVSSYLDKPRDPSGTTGWGIIRELCFEEDSWKIVLGHSKNREASATSAINDDQIGTVKC